MRGVLREIHWGRGTVLKDGDRPEPEARGAVEVCEGGSGGGGCGGCGVVVVVKVVVVVVLEGGAEVGWGSVLHACEDVGDRERRDGGGGLSLAVW